MIVLAQMHESDRRDILEKHTFFTKESKRRLISQFSDIEGEADQYVRDYAKQLEPAFDGEDGDWGAFWGEVNEQGRAHYFLLCDMKKFTILALTAGMYHNWDKHFREWLSREMSFNFTEKSVSKVWETGLDPICKFLKSNGWNVENSPSMKKILVMHDVVNAYKHGYGRSFVKVKQNLPEYLDDYITETLNIESGEFGFLPRQENLNVTEAQFHEFAGAIEDFWRQVPVEIMLLEEE